MASRGGNGGGWEYYVQVFKKEILGRYKI